MSAETEIVTSTPVSPTPEQGGGVDSRSGGIELRASVLRGLAWQTVLVVTVQVTRLATGLVLVRLLEPRDYGLAGMALVFSSFVLVFSDLGLGAGLVQRATITETDRSTAFWTSVAVGMMLCGAGIGLSGPLASFFHEPRVQPLFEVVSISFLITSLALTQAALFQRDMNFRPMSLRLMVAYLCGAAVGISVAALGGGPWALVAQVVTISAVSTTMLWILSSWTPRFVFSFRSLRNLAGFGIPVLGSQVLGYVQGNLDNVLVGRYIGSAALGVYSISYNVILLPLQRLFVPLQDTLFPALSRIQTDRERMARLWLRVTRVVGAVVAPAMLGLFVVAPDFVSVVLGHRWHGAVPVVRILAFVTLMQGFTAVGERALMATGKSQVVLRFAILRTALAVAAFIVGLHWGIVGVAAAYTAVTVPAQAYLLFLVTRTLDIRLSAFLGNLQGVAFASAVMFATCLSVRLLVLNSALSPGPRMGALIGVGIVSYGLALLWRGREILTDVRRLRSPQGKATAPPA